MFVLTIQAQYHIKLKTDSTFTHPENGVTVSELYCHQKALSWNIQKGYFALGNIVISASVQISCYASEYSDKEPFFEYYLSIGFQEAMQNGLFYVSPEHGVSTSEKNIYLYLINNVDLFKNFELAQ